jgi:hypothetical protein
LQSALEVRWCADADISAVLYLRPTEDIPMIANWLRKDAAVSFVTHIIDTDDADRSTESWDRVNEVLPQILTFMIEKLKVGCKRVCVSGHRTYFQLRCAREISRSAIHGRQ